MTGAMQGRVCLVTGATDGHGKAVAAALCRAGAEVVLLGRSAAKLGAVQAELAREGRAPETLLCDLSSRAQIDRAADELLARGRPLHLLVNNAGLVNRRRLETVDGVEMVLAVNYLAMFQLTRQLLPRLRQGAPARIVNVASDAHRAVRLRLDDLELRRGYSWWRSYAQSKLAVLYFTEELARRLAGSGVTVNAVDPGPVASNIAMNNSGFIVPLAGRVIRWSFPGPEQAARTALHLCCSNEVEGVSGTYWRFGERKAPRLDRRDPQGVAQRLWEISEEMTQVSWD